MLVNKEHTVDEFFMPDDLVQLKDVLGTKLVKIKYKKNQGRGGAVEALKAMLEAAKEDGIGKWQISAGYRTWDDQVKMLNNKVAATRRAIRTGAAPKRAGRRCGPWRNREPASITWGWPLTSTRRGPPPSREPSRASG